MRTQLGRFALLMAGLLGSACTVDEVLDRIPDRSFISADGRYRLQAPGSWAEDGELNKMSQLSISRRVSELYVIVLVEPGEQMPNATADQYLDVVLPDFTRNLTEVHEHERRPFVQDRLKGVRMDVEGTIDALRIYYINQVIKTKYEFIRIMAWTLASKKERNLPKLEKVISSLTVDKSPLKQENSVPSLTQTFRSPVGVSVEAPKGWFTIKNLSEQATIQIGNKEGSAFLMVIAESLTPELQSSPERFRELTLSHFRKVLAGAEVSEAETTTLGGRPGFLTQITGRLEGMDFTYLQGIVLTKEYGFQVMAWTSSKRDNIHQLMRNMVESVSFSSSIQ